VNSSSQSLHAPVISTPEHRAAVRSELARIRSGQERLFDRAAPKGPTLRIPITTVSRIGNFDANINVFFGEPPHVASMPLCVDSGNDTMVVPSFDAISSLPNFTKNYRKLADPITEPFGNRAILLQGPVKLPTADGMYEIPDCRFFACTDPNKTTSNFGTGWISPWRKFGGGQKFVVRPPTTYGPSPYRYAIFDYAPAPSVMTNSDKPKVAEGSSIILQRNGPFPGYELFKISRGQEKAWMSIYVRALSIGEIRTDWPGKRPLMAMVDTGGGPFFLSDPDGYLYPKHWPSPAHKPPWADEGSIACQAVKGPITVEIGDCQNWYSLRIDTSRLPRPVQGLTLVMCKKCKYMWNNDGMNIGGISALFNYILVDYEAGHVGLKSKGLATLI
jgi:hypothetical protein